jgi:hypothetical protein
VSLGVPGLALGIFYMLFRTFDWEFPIVPSNWVGPIIVLSMVLTSVIIFYTLTLWRPQSRPVFVPGNRIDPTDSGAAALYEVLQHMHFFLERESDRLGKKNSEIDNFSKQQEQKKIVDDAKVAVELATNHTRHYIASRRIGQRDRNTERELSDEWVKVGKCLQKIDIPEAHELHTICFIKARYWSDIDGWDDSYAEGKDIRLKNVLNMVKAITTHRHKG